MYHCCAGKILNPTDRPAQLNLDLEAPDDTLLAVHRSEDGEEKPDTVFDDDTDNSAPAVNIKCPK